MKNFASLQLLAALLLLGAKEIPARGLEQDAIQREPRASTVTATLAITCKYCHFLMSFQSFINLKNDNFLLQRRRLLSPRRYVLIKF